MIFLRLFISFVIFVLYFLSLQNFFRTYGIQNQCINKSSGGSHISKSSFSLLPLLCNSMLRLQSNLSVRSTVLSEPLRYLHSCRQTFSLFLPVHMLHSDLSTHRIHVEMCLSSAKTDIL